MRKNLQKSEKEKKLERGEGTEDLAGILNDLSCKSVLI
jgi:hypothetical protein